MTLPTLYDAEAAAAQQFADEQVQKWLDGGDFFGIGVSGLRPEAGHLFGRQILKQLAMADDCKMIEIINAARNGCEDAQIAMRELFIELRNQGRPVPVALDAYSLELVHPRLQRRTHGPKKASYILQDVAFVSLVGMMHKRFPTLHVYGRSGRHLSIIGIAAAAFTKHRHHIDRDLTYEAGRKIWQRWGD